MKCLAGIVSKVLILTAAVSVSGPALAKKPGEKVSAWIGPAKARVIKRSIASAPASTPTPAPKTASTEAELRNRIAKNDKDIQSRIKLAELFQKKKDFDGMVGTLRPASDNLPRKGMLLLAAGYRGQKNHLNEVRVLELLLAQNRKDYYVMNAVGEAYISLGKNEEAIEKFQETRKLNNRFLPSYKNLLALYDAGGEKYEARNLLNDMIRIFGPRAEFFNELCRLYSVDGFLEKSAETCRKAILKQPSHAPNHMYYSQTLWDLEKKDDALRVLKQAAKQFQKSEEVQDAAGEMTYNVGDFINSFKLFTQCVKAHAQSAKCQLGYAKSAFELQKYQEALDGFVALCKLDNGSLGEFRKATATLRQKNEFIWINKYDAGQNRCSAITGT
jgi:tetratricopeptide (TPR) repeat protein